MKYEDIYERLLDVTEEFSIQGASTFDVANVMARFVVELSYDCAPDTQHATTLLLTAITDRMERDIEQNKEVA